MTQSEDLEATKRYLAIRYASTSRPPPATPWMLVEGLAPLASFDTINERPVNRDDLFTVTYAALEQIRANAKAGR